MKTISSKYNVILLLLLLCSISVSSQSFSKEGRVVRSFALADDTEIEITNKYGDISVENWDIDSIKIEILYKVSATKKSKLDPVYDAINFDFKSNKYYIVAKTVFEGRGSFWFDVSEIAGNLFGGGITTSIDYTIYLPAKRNLKVNLKYGSIYMTDYAGYFNLTLSNGNFRAHNLTGTSILNVDFGDVVVKEIVTGVVKIRYGTLELQKAKELDLTGQSSEFDLGDVDRLTLDSKRDRISIEGVDLLIGSNYFTKLNVNEITGKLELSTKYGSFKLNRIASEVSAIQLTSYNTLVDFYFTDENNYSIKLISDSKADVSYSAKLGEFEVKELPNKLKEAVCVHGNVGNAVPVNIETKSGVLTLKVR